MTVANTSANKLTQLRVQRALAKPGAIGMKGLLLWTEAAFPRAIAQQVLQAAAKYTPGASPSGIVPTLASPASQGFGFLGDTASDAANADAYWTVSTSDANPSDPTTPPVSATTAATASQPASASWLADIGSAFKAASQGALAVLQAKDAQSIFSLNLQRAQQGLAPIPYNPTQLGLPAPTANIGLASSAQTTVLIVGGIVAIALFGGLLAGARRK